MVPYSARARTGAPAAVPVEWEELMALDQAAGFTIANACALIDRAGEPALEGWSWAEQSLPNA